VRAIGRLHGEEKKRRSLAAAIRPCQALRPGRARGGFGGWQPANSNRTKARFPNGSCLKVGACLQAMFEMTATSYGNSAIGSRSHTESLANKLLHAEPPPHIASKSLHAVR
jgi:hypothetical protein